MCIYFIFVYIITVLKEQDKSSDIEQQPPFGDRKISNIQPQNRGVFKKLKVQALRPYYLLLILLSPQSAEIFLRETYDRTYEDE